MLATIRMVYITSFIANHKHTIYSFFEKFRHNILTCTLRSVNMILRQKIRKFFAKTKRDAGDGPSAVHAHFNHHPKQKKKFNMKIQGALPLLFTSKTDTRGADCALKTNRTS